MPPYENEGVCAELRAFLAGVVDLEGGKFVERGEPLLAVEPFYHRGGERGTLRTALDPELPAPRQGHCEPRGRDLGIATVSEIYDDVWGPTRGPLLPL